MKFPSIEELYDMDLNNLIILKHNIETNNIEQNTIKLNENEENDDNYDLIDNNLSKEDMLEFVNTEIKERNQFNELLDFFLKPDEKYFSEEEQKPIIKQETNKNNILLNKKETINNLLKRTKIDPMQLQFAVSSNKYMDNYWRSSGITNKNKINEKEAEIKNNELIKDKNKNIVKIKSLNFVIKKKKKVKESKQRELENFELRKNYEVPDVKQFLKKKTILRPLNLSNNISKKEKNNKTVDNKSINKYTKEIYNNQKLNANNIKCIKNNKNENIGYNQKNNDTAEQIEKDDKITINCQKIENIKNDITQANSNKIKEDKININETNDINNTNINPIDNDNKSNINTNNDISNKDITYKEKTDNDNNKNIEEEQQNISNKILLDNIKTEPEVENKINMSDDLEINLNIKEIKNNTIEIEENEKNIIEKDNNNNQENNLIIAVDSIIYNDINKNNIDNNDILLNKGIFTPQNINSEKESFKKQFFEEGKLKNNEGNSNNYKIINDKSNCNINENSKSEINDIKDNLNKEEIEEYEETEEDLYKQHQKGMKERNLTTLDFMESEQKKLIKQKQLAPIKKQSTNSKTTRSQSFTTKETIRNNKKDLTERQRNQNDSDYKKYTLPGVKNLKFDRPKSTYNTRKINKTKISNLQNEIIDYSDIYNNLYELFNGYFLLNNYSNSTFNYENVLSELYTSFKHIYSYEINSQDVIEKKDDIYNGIVEAENGIIKNRVRKAIDKLLKDPDIKTNVEKYQILKQCLNFEKTDLSRINKESDESNNYKKFFRVVLSRPEIYDIICYTLYKDSSWSELPHGLSLGTCWNLLWTYGPPNIDFNKIFSFQKVNHLVNSRTVHRKDYLHKNIMRVRKMNKKNNDLFNIMPLTFLLSKEYIKFVEEFSRIKDNSPEDSNIWIVKPVGKSRGKGIFLINEISDVPLNDTFLVQKYLSNPLLIGEGYKFDMRIYILITSVNPLEMFLYKDGFARISNELYSSKVNDITNIKMHLTNAAIQNNQALHSNKFDKIYGGSKISLEVLSYKLYKQYRLNFNDVIWPQVKDIIIKAFTACQFDIPYCPSSFELFGFDIIIDSNYKCWLLEINSSPSLARTNVLDDQIKLPLIEDTMNIIDPININKESLVKMLERLMHIKTNSNTYLYSPKIQLNMDLTSIFNGKKSRKYGEVPQKMGRFEMICPTKESEKIIKAAGGQKMYNNIREKMNRLTQKTKVENTKKNPK